MLDDDPFDPSIGEDREFTDPGTEAEGKARDLEAELHERRDTPESRIASRVDELSSVDAGSEVAVPFWAAVIFANVGVLFVTIGPMLAYFRGQTIVGAVLTIVGAFALWRTYSIYRSFKRQRRERSASAEGEAVDGEASGNEATSDHAASDETASDETTSDGIDRRDG